MSILTYLSVPYSAPDPDLVAHRALQARIAAASLVASGRLVLCPVAMNHEMLELMNGNGMGAPKGYWRGLEERLAASCDELVVLTLEGWEQSRGVARELVLFSASGKSVLQMASPHAAPAPFAFQDRSLPGGDAGR